MEKLNDEMKDLEKQMESLKQKKMELLLRNGKAYRCRKCGKIIEKDGSKAEKEQLCFTCWAEEVKKRRHDELMQKFKEAKIIDVEPRENPYSNLFEVEKIVLKANGKRYVIEADGWDERYITIEEGD